MGQKKQSPPFPQAGTPADNAIADNEPFIETHQHEFLELSQRITLGITVLFGVSGESVIRTNSTNSCWTKGTKRPWGSRDSRLCFHSYRELCLAASQPTHSSTRKEENQAADSVRKENIWLVYVGPQVEAGPPMRQYRAGGRKVHVVSTKAILKLERFLESEILQY